MSATPKAQRLSTSVRRRVSIKSVDLGRNVTISHVETKASNTALTGLKPDGSPVSSKSVLRTQVRRQGIVERCEQTCCPDAKVLLVTNKQLEQAFLDVKLIPDYS